MVGVLRSLAGTVLLALAMAAPARTDSRAPADRIAVRAGRIITVSGPEIRNGVILITDGRIERIGTGLEIPAGATIIDASASVVMPGLFDAAPAFGLEASWAEEGGEIQPHLRTIDAFPPTHPVLRRLLASGVTTSYVGPGNRSVIGGLGSIIKTHGRTLQEMVVREDVALKAALGTAPVIGNVASRYSAPNSIYSRRPTTRMGVVWELRKAFLDAQSYRDQPPVRRDPAMEVLLKALGRKLPVRISASRSGDIETAAAIAQEFRLSVVIEDAVEAYRQIPLLQKLRLPILLRPNFTSASGPGPDTVENRYSTFAALSAAGLRTAMVGGGPGEGEGLLTLAIFAARHGASRPDALRAVTLTPAEILGVAESVGCLETGRHADLLFLSGDPLEATTRIERVMVRGKLAVDNTRP